ncbi:MAG: tetratricopeptide repeat protein, partial [Planctomycetota bacterium]
RGDLDEAMRLFGEALEINKRLGSLEGQAIQLGNMGLVAQTRGDLDEARRLWDEALGLFTKIGAKPQIEQTERLLASLDSPSPPQGGDKT